MHGTTEATSLALIIPAYNEAAHLPATLAAAKTALAALPPGCQTVLVVVDNNSTDRTPEIARERAATVVFEPVNQISRARNAGARSVSCDYLVFLDADTILLPETLGQAYAHLASGAVCGGGATIVSDRPFPAFVRGMLATWNRVSARRSIAAGSFLFCPADAFRDTGGFDEKVYAGEEIWFSRALKKWGKKNGRTGFPIITDPPVTTSARKGDWFSSFAIGFQLTAILICPWITRSRKLCPIWYRRPPE